MVLLLTSQGVTGYGKERDLMYINEPDPEVKLVDDLSFMFTNGLTLELTVDESLGDRVDYKTHPSAIIVNLAPRPSFADPSTKLPGKDLTIFYTHSLSIEHRKREVTALTRAQHDQLAEVWNKPHETVQ